ncbi:hypothetical protein DFH94DRAFT_138145 [Russula ochroleuca]|uniref:BOD1/SHG1 domain-containing protein n=1 Tax=Russula ochroleuca TaxID=152965 RepID=A0A9P5JZM3_9AGAM|nr:hypothetical protein DFH94DRAFT_138145 [Russula ochroleuca]
MPDPIKSPDALVKEFKKSGEFDRLRRDLLTQFQNGDDGTEAFWARVDDIARTRLDAEDKLHLKAADTLHRELLQELDRFPLVERAVADVPALADPEFAAGIRRHAQDLLQRSRDIPVEEDHVLPPNADARDERERERRNRASSREKETSRD